uniref:CKLF-like MARVEL transmembrane domain-containing protein 8 n=1 Tax=Ciona intestinalis TaxID=7719 RepID=F6RRQ4_CIOIN|nr:CKLF-like MARVEL transmembrane domain-containing protein 8 [Ciona intestinalis]|eukprot:XP_002130442.1 CKLF-like MARVEL transmembrane domain-containing protein 8 [Ciona intestinalis]
METESTSTTTTTAVPTKQYLFSPQASFQIWEMIFGLICWAIIASHTLLQSSPAWQFVMFVSVSSWSLTLIRFVICLADVNDKVCPGLSWKNNELIFNGFSTLLYFIASCVAAAYTGGFSRLIAATVFACFTTMVYTVHTALAIRDNKVNSAVGVIRETEQ